ncbi:MAG: NPCBM/NEW2 domain-containing protein [Planctomycetaceae bacterium]
MVFKFIAISLALMDVRVSLLDGQAIEGTLQQLNADSVVVAVDGTDQSLPVEDVVELKFPHPDKLEAEPLQMILRDASEIPITEATATSETVTAKSVVLGDLNVRRPAVRAIRLQPLKDEWQPQWTAFLERSNDKDLLIVAKRDGSGLDFLAGVVGSVGAEEVPFLLDGDEIPVPRSRVFGVVFAVSKEADTDRSVGLALQLTSGATLKARSVTLAGEQFEFETAWGQTLSLRSERLSGIDFSSGRLHYLSDLEPLSERYFGLDPPGREWGPLFEADLATRTGLSSQWRMSRDRFPNNGRPPLTLRNTVYRKGLCIFPKAAIEYALDGQYSRLTAIVGVDDDVAYNQQKGQPPTAVELRIEADGEEVFRRLVKAPEAPFPLDVPLAGVTTLTILVDFGDGESTCDYLDLADAKLIVDTSEK